jgi:hypothetical protein
VTARLLDRLGGFAHTGREVRRRRFETFHGPAAVVENGRSPPTPRHMDIASPNVYVRHTGTARGRGAYAARRFGHGETIESCPVILFAGKFSSVPEEVRKLLFNWGHLAGTTQMHCLALGYGSLYNHANPSNMRYAADTSANVLRFVAVRDIGEHEELTVNYNAVGGGHDSDEDTWFHRMGVTPLLE